ALVVDGVAVRDRPAGVALADPLVDPDLAVVYVTTRSGEGHVGAVIGRVGRVAVVDGRRARVHPVAVGVIVAAGRVPDAGRVVVAGARIVDAVGRRAADHV